VPKNGIDARSRNPVDRDAIGVVHALEAEARVDVAQRSLERSHVHPTDVGLAEQRPLGLERAADGEERLDRFYLLADCRETTIRVSSHTGGMRCPVRWASRPTSHGNRGT